MTDMIRVSSTEFGKEVGRYQDMALVQPVVVTRNGRDRVVMISTDEYHFPGLGPKSHARISHGPHN